jgi:hypothetical protein
MPKSAEHMNVIKFTDLEIRSPAERCPNIFQSPCARSIAAEGLGHSIASPAAMPPSMKSKGKTSKEVISVIGYRTFHVINEQSSDEKPYEKAARRRSPASVVLSLLALVLVLVLGIYLTIPAREFKTPVPDPTAQAIHDLQTSLQQTVDQLNALQQKVSSDQAEKEETIRPA